MRKRVIPDTIITVNSIGSDAIRYSRAYFDGFWTSQGGGGITVLSGKCAFWCTVVLFFKLHRPECVQCDSNLKIYSWMKSLLQATVDFFRPALPFPAPP